MTESSPRRLTRSIGAAKVGGVCAGLATYLDTDVTLVRVAWIVLSIWPGAIVLGVVAYISAWLLMPVADETASSPASRRQLTRSRAERRIAGVCGGLAEYLDADPTIIRVAWVVLTIVPCAIVFGVIAYVVAWVIVPAAPAPTPPVPIGLAVG